MHKAPLLRILFGLLIGGTAIAAEVHKPLALKKGDNIVILGSGMASRMNHFGHFETELQLRFPKLELTIRNIGDEGNTPAFRPHPGREFAQQDPATRGELNTEGFFAGTGAPILPSKVIRATCFMYVDFPDIFGPVIIIIC